MLAVSPPPADILTCWEPATAEAWLREIRARLGNEQPFLAFDLAQRATARHPRDDRLALAGILALLRGGSVATARQVLESHLGSDYTPGDKVAKALLAEIRERLWENGRRREDLLAARELFRSLFAETAKPHPGMAAAVLSLAAGERSQAQDLARALLRQGAANPPEAADTHRLSRGIAALIAGDPETAIAAFRRIADQAPDYHPMLAALRWIRVLTSAGLTPPEEVAILLTPPRILIFGGQPIDPPGLPEALLPPEKVPALAEAIGAEIQRLQARIGYVSASCGGDLLFAEALLEAGGELHLVLPCAEEDFLAARVAYAGPEWVARFQRTRERAATVTYATRERYLGHSELLRYANQMIAGLGWLRAQFLFTEPYLLAAWDYRAQAQPGSAADFIDHWPDIRTLRIIPLDELPRQKTTAFAVPSAPACAVPQEPRREIRAMLFADVVGYSKLGEEYLPQWWEFLAALQPRLAAVAIPDLVEAWGDSIYAVLASASALLRYAFTLRGAFLEPDHQAYGLPWQLGIRIGLHAGPVFQGVHPLTHRPIYSGHQVNRAARIEPITMAGEVYASQEFVALLTAEEMAVRHECHFFQRAYTPWYQANYLGRIEMPKQHGIQPVYHLLPATEANANPASLPT